MPGLDRPTSAVARPISGSERVPAKPAKLFDAAIVADPQAATGLITSILEFSTGTSIIAMDLTGKILLWNEGARRLYGYEPDEAIDKLNLSNLYAPEDVKAGLPQKITDDALHDGKFEGTVSCRSKSGERHTVRAVVTTRRDASGKPIGLLLISEDITDELRAAKYVRSLIEASLDPLFIINGDGKITDVNKATMDITGLSGDKLNGTDFSIYFTEPEKAQHACRQAFAKGMAANYPLTIRHAEGRLTEVLFNAAVYRNERGSVLGVLAAARDITPQKRAEAQLAEQHAVEMDRLAELERFQKLTVGRELKMIELKKEIEELKRKVAEPNSDRKNASAA